MSGLTKKDAYELDEFMKQIEDDQQWANQMQVNLALYKREKQLPPIDNTNPTDNHLNKHSLGEFREGE